MVFFSPLQGATWAGGTGNWSDTTATGWNGAAPNAQGAIANVNATSSSPITVDLPVTVGTLNYGGANNFLRTIFLTNSITFDQDGAGAGFATLSNTNTNAGNLNRLSFNSASSLVLADDLLISNTSASTNATGAITIFGDLSGTGNLTISNVSNSINSGNISIGQASTFTGSVLVQKGVVTLSTTGFGGVGNAVTLGSTGNGSATLWTSGTTTALANNITVASGTGGTLLLGSSDAGAANSSFTGTITLNGDLSISSVKTGGASVNFTNTISGAGGLTKEGSGIAILSGTNTYTGSTTVNAGILRAGAATSAFGNNSAVTMGNVAGGVLDLNNLNETIGSLSGGGATGGNVSLGTGTLTAGGNNTSTTYAGVISGTGGLTKTGTGIWTLTGTNTATGLATISDGTLVIGTAGGGSWGGGTTVNSGGILKGRGAIAGAVTINNGGTYSPGNSPGIQTVGSLTLNAGSNTIFEIDGAAAGNGAGFYDQIQVTGAATINGGTVTPQTIFTGSSGFSPVAGQTFTVISAGSLTGQFTAVDNTGNASGLTFIPQYTGTAVILVATFESLSSSSTVALLSLDPRQTSVARALDQFRPASIDSSPGHVMSDPEVIYQALGRLPASQIPSAIDQMSPEKLEAISKTSQSFAVGMNRQVGRQLQIQRGAAPAMGTLSSYDLNGQTIYEPVAGLGDETSFVTKKKFDKLSYFTSITGEQGEVKPSEQRTDFNYWSASAVHGINYKLSPILSWGGFGAYGHSSASLGGSGGNLDYNTGKLGAYVSFHPSYWFWDTMASVGKGFYETERNISFLGQKASGQTEGWDFTGETRLGRDLSMGRFTLSPYVLARYARTLIDAYSETGSAARLHMSAMDQSSIVSGGGINLQYAIPLGKMSLVPRLYGIYEREWIRSEKIKARFAAGGSDFIVRGDPIDADQLTGGIGSSLVVSSKLQFDLNFEMETLQNDLARRAVNLAAKYSF